jgi:hypothetical protein
MTVREPPREHRRPDEEAPDLATRQRELVAALVAGAPVPAGLDHARVAAARRALLGKRAGEVADAWPLLAAALDSSAPGETFRTLFTRWAGARPPRGALRDGWDFARELASADRLPELAARELAARDVHSRYDGHREPRPRRLPAMRRVADGWLVGLPGFGVCLVGCPSGVLRRHTG